jgi:drug/metabolite transporter superfamily protein YnfA
MRSAFNIVMRIVSTLLGVLLVCMGGIWMLQGLNIAFKVGFMVGDPKWTLFGAILALVGVAQIVWSNTRQA